MFNSLCHYELQPTRLLGPWDSPGKNTVVGCHFLLQGIFPNQGSKLGPLHCRQILYHCVTREAHSNQRLTETLRHLKICFYLFLNREPLACEVKVITTTLQKQGLGVHLSIIQVMYNKPMATHSSILAWKISWAKESGALQSMGS